jgi:hypothetical protein
MTLRTIHARVAIVAAFACLVHAAARADSPGGHALSQPVTVELLDGSRRVGWPAGLFEAGLSTPASKRPPASNSARVLRLVMERGTVEIPTIEIRQIVVQPIAQRVIGSDESVRSLSLGYGIHKVDEPAGWSAPAVRNAGWEAASAQWPDSRWRYVPQATWIWASKSRRSYPDETGLFRHEFDLPTTMVVLSAYLDVSADDFLDALYVNGVNAALPRRSLSSSVVEWDITYLLRPGRNVLAARVSNSPASGQNSVGLCYRVRCDLIPNRAGGEERAAPGVVLWLSNGDRLSGRLLRIAPKQWAIAHPSGRINLDPDWIEVAMMNYAAPPSEERWRIPMPGPLESLEPLLLTPMKVLPIGRHRAVTLAAIAAVAWGTEPAMVAAKQGLLMRNGEWVEGRIEGLRDNRVWIKPRYGAVFAVPVPQVSTVQPNRPEPRSDFIFEPSTFPYAIQARLANNDQITGALVSLTGTEVVIAPQFTPRVRVDLDQVVTIRFIMNPAAQYRAWLADAWPAPVPRRVAVIGEPATNEGYDAPIVEIQRTLIDLGFEMRWLNANQIVEEGFLTPERFPLLINFDQNERLYYSIMKEGDGFAAIRRYVLQGGSIAHFARSVPFSYGYVAENGRWTTRKAPRNLNAELMMDIIPSDRQLPNAQSFEAPPTNGRRLYFVLNPNAPFARGLPERVELPVLTNKQFRPVIDDCVTSPARFHSVYRLVDDAGNDYGTAMAIIEYGPIEGRPHCGVYVSHLLYQASADGVSMVRYLLPRVLRLTLASPPT